MKRFLEMLLVVLMTALVSGCSQPREMKVSAVWARPGNVGGTSAVYLVVENNTQETDTLTGASAAVAQAVELHMSSMQADGTMTMRPQESVPAPAGEKVEFKPGGLHIMLVNLNQDLKAGDTFPLTLTFQNNGEIQVDVEVKQP